MSHPYTPRPTYHPHIRPPPSYPPPHQSHQQHQQHQQTWTCPHCTTQNPTSRYPRACIHCRTPQPPPPAPAPAAPQSVPLNQPASIQQYPQQQQQQYTQQRYQTQQTMLPPAHQPQQGQYNTVRNYPHPPQVGAAGRQKYNPTQPKFNRDGQWECEVCAQMNHPSVIACEGCTTERDLPANYHENRVAGGRGAGYGRENHMNMRGGAGGQERYELRGGAGAHLGRPPYPGRADSYGGYRNGHGGGRGGYMERDRRPAAARGGTREGDWRCPDESCGYMNYASRVECAKCQAPSPYPQAEYGGRPPGRVPREPSSPFRFGDWICGGCQVHNYAFRNSCIRCDAPAPVDRATPASAMGALRVGDWICSNPQCNYHNYASREACYKCSTPNVAMIPTAP